ncbi:hypothetical protein HPP92_024155 [Vanilla planifolia]|uniref:Chaperone DnaJ C-terminal domain-containing protein n=1 Tax=Vanilla planifolia TaxID=51239 RepID=A0A835PP75_VANPL|nr:hypothetical protein HPP92_024155 [Vanilla planifolia]
MKKEGSRNGEGSSSSSMEADYYKILQVDRKAKDGDLKKADHNLKMELQADFYLSSGIGDDVFGSAADVVREKKALPIEKKLPCSLEELYTGTTKEMKISREIADISPKVMPIEDILMIDINVGLKNGTKIPYPKKEDDVIPADIVFVVEEMPHEMFTREGNDLFTTQKISLAQALMGYTTHLKTLDGRTLTIPISSISSVIHLRYEKGGPRRGYADS